MNFLDRDLRDLREDDLQLLIDQRVLENKHLEYKAVFNDLSDEKVKHELLADLSSFANTDGGDFFVGISETSGIPRDLRGLPIEDLDRAKRRVEDILKANLTPRISTEIEKIAVGGGSRFVMAIRVKKSWTPPHRITTSGRFYGRNSAGKFEMDVEQLRIAFGFTSAVGERIRGLHGSLTSWLSSGVPFNDGHRPALSICLIPLAAVASPSPPVVDIRSAAAHAQHLCFASDWRPYYNFDGLAAAPCDSSAVANLRAMLRRVHGVATSMFGGTCFSQLYRNGMIHFVDGEITEPPSDGLLKISEIVSPDFEAKVIHRTAKMFAMIREVQVAAPVAVFVDLFGVADSSLKEGPRMPPQTAAIGYAFDRDYLPLFEHQADRVDQSREDVARMLKPAFDSLWNAGGFASCPYFNAAGDCTIDEGFFRRLSV